MIQKSPLVPLSSQAKASRVKIDAPGTPPDPAVIQYGGKPPKSERTPQTTAAQTTAAQTTAAQTTAAQTTAAQTTAAEPTPAQVPLASAVKAVSLPPEAKALASPVPPMRLAAQTIEEQAQKTQVQTRPASAGKPPPSPRSLAGRYDVLAYGMGLLPNPGPPTRPEHLGLDYPPPDGPVLALVGQYGLSPGRGPAPLLSVSYACNFHLSEHHFQRPQPGSLDPGQTGSLYTVGVLMPTLTALGRPDLGQLIGFALRAAGVSPQRFQSPKWFQTNRPEALPDTLTMLLHFDEPGGWPLRGLFQPPLPRRALLTRLSVAVPDLAGRSYKITVGAYNAGRLSGRDSLADAQCYLSLGRGQEAAGGMALVSSLLADPAALLAGDSERYGQAAAQMARLVILGRRPYNIPVPP